MGKIFAIFFKDVRSYLYSIIAYAMITIFLGLSGFFFSTAMSYFSFYSMQASSQPYLQQQGLNLTETVISNLFFNISVILLLMMPILTMRLVAEEQKQGTLELLLSYSVNEFHVVFGKFLAAAAIYFLMISPMALHLYLLKWAGGQFEWGVVISAFVGLSVMGMAFLSFGVFASSLSENQIVSAVISFGFLLVLWMIGWVSSFLPAPLAVWADGFSLVRHAEDFFKGVIETKHFVYYFLFTAFFILLATWRLEARKWVR